MSTNEITDKIVLVALKFSIFSGYKRSSLEDIAEAGGTLPDTDVLTRGGKRIFPREHLAPFGTLKKEILRHFWKTGVRALGGAVWATPADKVPEMEAYLNDKEKAFRKLLDNLDANYDMWMAEYEQENASCAGIIHASALSREDAVRRFGYGYDLFKISPAGTGGGSVESMAKGLASQLFTEVAQAASEVMTKSMAGKDKAGQKSLHQIKACQSKMAALGFIDPSVASAASAVAHVLAGLPQTGYIENTPGNDCFSRLHRLVDLMTIPTKFEEAGKRIADGENVDDVLRPQASINQVLDLTGDLFVPPQSVPIQDAPEPEKTVATEEATEAEGEFEPEALFF